MTITHLLEGKGKFEIQAYARPKNMDRDTHIPFSGAPRKHPLEKNKIILIVDPFTTNTFYYEFNIEDIGFAEELANLTNIDGDAIPMARIWVKKQSVGVRCTPFIVDTIVPRRN
ncbi:MAG: inorganic pyrophosphatase Ppa [Proteobacteria bacterium]|nr:inorganic pyrophosphatase Ppa [Pseudomonadota bacterium]